MFGSAECEGWRDQLGSILEECLVAFRLDQDIVLRLDQTFGFVRQGISAVAGCPAVCNAGISDSGGANVANADRDILEDSLDAGVTVDEPFACEVYQKTVGAEEIGT